jgi:hypothetical protein
VGVEPVGIGGEAVLEPVCSECPLVVAEPAPQLGAPRAYEVVPALALEPGDRALCALEAPPADVACPVEVPGEVVADEEVGPFGLDHPPDRDRGRLALRRRADRPELVAVPVAGEAEELDWPGRRTVEGKYSAQLSVVSTGNCAERAIGGEVRPPQRQPLRSCEDVAARFGAGSPAGAERLEPGDFLELEGRAQLFAFRGINGLTSAKPAEPSRERRQRMYRPDVLTA